VTVDWLAATLPPLRRQAAWVIHKARKLVRGLGVRVATRVGKAAKVVVRFVQRSAHRWQRARAR
jgi:ubiquinone biosynthesis protein UbiJ